MDLFRAYAPLLAAAALSGCATTTPSSPGSAGTSGTPAAAATPDWIFNVPSDPQYLYAVGICQRTWGGQEEQRQQAAARAREAIARAIRTEIKSTTFVSESERNSAGSSESAYATEQNILADTDALVEKCEETSWWLDRTGELGTPQTIYVLVRCPRSEIFK